MADFAANFTNRLRVRYIVLGKPHSVTFRYGIIALPWTVDFSDDVEAFLNTLTNVRFASWTVTGAEWAQAGSDVFLPVAAPSPDVGAVALTGTGLVPVNLNFQGLSALGNRAAIYVYGVNFGPTVGGTADEANYRMELGEDARVDAAIAYLGADTLMTGIDGEALYWHQYANINVNAHWQRKARS